MAGRGRSGRSLLPPNFRLGRVSRTHGITPRFIRLRIEAEDLADLNQTGLHLRRLQPKDPENLLWPRLLPNGRTGLPGAAHLRMLVYTIRSIDPGAGWLEVDVFLHGKGPTCAWGQSVRPGAAVGLSGPGGGWLPAGRRLCLGADFCPVPPTLRPLLMIDLASRTGYPAPARSGPTRKCKT